MEYTNIKDKVASDALRDVKQFFETCVPEDLRPKYFEISQELFPENFKRLRDLRHMLSGDLSKLSGPELNMICNEYRNVSRIMIIQGSVQLLIKYPKREVKNLWWVA